MQLDGVGYVPSGTDITVTAPENYELKSITVNGEALDITDNQDGTYTFTMPADNVTYDLALTKAAADQAAADAVVDAFDALPTEVTVADKDAIEAARAAYDALTTDQKALIDEDTMKKLTDAEKAYDTLPILGDADGDGEVTILDATAIQRYLAALPNETFVEALADVDGDGDISILDATFIQRWLVSLDDGYQIGSKVNRQS